MFTFDIVLQEGAVLAKLSVQIVEVLNLPLFSGRVKFWRLVRPRAQVVVAPVLHVLVLLGGYVLHFSAELVEVAVALSVCGGNVLRDDVPAGRNCPLQILFVSLSFGKRYF